MDGQRPLCHVTVMMTTVKICGLTTQDTLDVALDAGADAVGFVFFAKSPRNIAPEAAARLADRARGRARIVALTVDAGDEELAVIMQQTRPDVLQLHGHESPARVAELKRRYQTEIWKALPVGEAADLAAAGAYESADRILLDARPPKGATRPGGNAVPFDWTLLAALDRTKPFVLSGGLTPENVGEAIRITAAPAVDVSSGVESAPGVKDPDRIRAFIQAARSATGK